MRNFDILWLTHGLVGTPHRVAFTDESPGVYQHVYTSNNVGNDGWRNCDRNLRNALRSLRLNSEYILAVEYDCLINQELHFDTGIDVGCRWYEYGQRRWDWLTEAERLPEEMKHLACGVVPLGVLLLSHKFIEAYISKNNIIDAMYKEDIFCELRFGTVARYLGFDITEMDWPDVRFNAIDRDTTKPSIYHPIK